MSTIEERSRDARDVLERCEEHDVWIEVDDPFGALPDKDLQQWPFHRRAELDDVVFEQPGRDVGIGSSCPQTTC